MLRVWNMVARHPHVLASRIFGTFLTRSRRHRHSVHSFTQSGLGAVLHRLHRCSLLTVGVGLLVYRLPLLRTQRRLESLALARGGVPLQQPAPRRHRLRDPLGRRCSRSLSEAVRGEQITVGPPFFNLVNAPLGIALLFLTGVGPLHRVAAARRREPRAGAFVVAASRAGAGRGGCSSALAGVRVRVARAIVSRSRRSSLGDRRAGVLARHARAAGHARRGVAARALGRLVGKQPAPLRRLHRPRRHRARSSSASRRRARSASSRRRRCGRARRWRWAASRSASTASRRPRTRTCRA